MVGAVFIDEDTIISNSAKLGGGTEDILEPDNLKQLQFYHELVLLK